MGSYLQKKVEESFTRWEGNHGHHCHWTLCTLYYQSNFCSLFITEASQTHCLVLMGTGICLAAIVHISIRCFNLFIYLSLRIVWAIFVLLTSLLLPLLWYSLFFSEHPEILLGPYAQTTSKWCTKVITNLNWNSIIRCLAFGKDSSQAKNIYGRLPLG